MPATQANQGSSRPRRARLLLLIHSLATAPLELLERKKANVDAAVDASSHPDW